MPKLPFWVNIDCELLPISPKPELSAIFRPASVELALPVIAPPAEMVKLFVAAVPTFAPRLTPEVAPEPLSEIVVPVIAPLITTAFCARAPPEIVIVEPAPPVIVLLTVATPFVAVTVMEVPDSLPGVVTLLAACNFMFVELMAAVLLNNKLPVEVKLTLVEGVAVVPSVPFI